MSKKLEKEQIGKIALFVALVCIILVVVITSIVINNKKKKLEDLKNQNELVKPEEGEEENQIFLKNISISIDKTNII